MLMTYLMSYVLYLIHLMYSTTDAPKAEKMSQAHVFSTSSGRTNMTG